MIIIMIDSVASFDDCINASIQDAIQVALKRLPQLEAEERYCILMEMCEWITTAVDIDDELIAPRFDERAI